MVLFEVEVNDSEFRQWAERSVENIKVMVNVLKEIRVMIYEVVAPLTPLKDDFLTQSLMQDSKIVDSSPFFELQLTMTGIHNPSADGWDYALYQHDKDLKHPRRGQMKYLKKGFEEAKPMFMKRLETDYLTAIGGHK